MADMYSKLISNMVGVAAVGITAGVTMKIMDESFKGTPLKKMKLW